jgi:hypothetical protein
MVFKQDYVLGGLSSKKADPSRQTTSFGCLVDWLITPGFKPGGPITLSRLASFWGDKASSVHI